MDCLGEGWLWNALFRKQTPTVLTDVKACCVSRQEPESQSRVPVRGCPGITGSSVDWLLGDFPAQSYRHLSLPSYGSLPRHRTFQVRGCVN